MDTITTPSNSTSYAYQCRSLGFTLGRSRTVGLIARPIVGGGFHRPLPLNSGVVGNSSDRADIIATEKPLGLGELVNCVGLVKGDLS